MDHSPGFLKIVNEVRPSVREISVDEVSKRLSSNPSAKLVDVREDSEWNAGRVTGAVHLGKGVLERDLERKFPQSDTELLLYCGGGYRSVLAADVARKMGYTNVYSIAGGYKAFTASGWRIEK